MSGRRDAAPRPSAWARWRVDLRLARRQVWRARASSLLVVLLVGLPVLGLSGAAVFAQSHVGTPAQKATVQLGRTQAMIGIAGGADPSRRQAVDEPGYTQIATNADGSARHPEKPAPQSPDAVIPPGTKVIELGLYGAAYVATATGAGQVGATTGPAWNPALRGRFVIVSGTAPTSDDEAMVSPALLHRLGKAVGDTLTLTDTGTSFRITGTLRQVDSVPDDQQMFLPASAASLLQTAPTWFTVDWQPDYAAFKTMVHAGFSVYARDLAVDPPAGALRAYAGDSAGWAMLAVGAIAAGFCGYLVVLLAGAAFAVAARRQQRALAMAASVGAVRGDVFRIVVLQGTVLGLVAGVVGTTAGIGLAAVALAVTDRGVVGSFWGNWGLNVPWPLIAGIAVFAIVVGTLAAVVPARGATHGGVLDALRGARRPARLNPKRPLWGLGLMILGLAATVGGGLGIAALNTAKEVDYGSPLRGVLLVGIVAGPLVFQIGVIVGGHWTLVMLSHVASRGGLAARIAGRDAAAHPSRVIPAFAAIAACVFIASFALSATAMVAAGNRQNYTWTGHLGTVGLMAWGLSADDDPDEVAQKMQNLVAPTDPSATAMLWTSSDAPRDPRDGKVSDPAAPVWSVAGAMHDDGCDRCAPEAQLGGNPPTVLDPADVATILGAALPADAQRVLEDGGAVELRQRSEAGSVSVDHDTLTLVRWSAGAWDAYNEKLPDYWSGRITAAELPEPAQKRVLPAVSIVPRYPQSFITALISTDTARALGMTLVPQTLFAFYPQPPGDDVVDALTAAAENTRVSANTSLQVMAERGPAPIDPVLWLISGATMVLVLGAGAVCLGLARFERRSDDATLAAVGAGRGLRRRVNAWQALIVVGLGTVVGAAAGLIPTWGITQMSSGYLTFAEAPWPWLVVIALGLPAVMAAASWLIPPRSPDLTRRTVIA